MGYATQIDVTIHIDSSITMVDDGRGIPVDDMVDRKRTAQPQKRSSKSRKPTTTTIKLLEKEILQRPNTTLTRWAIGKQTRWVLIALQYNARSDTATT